MSFDAWVVGFGLSKVLIELGLATSPRAYLVWLAVIVIDLFLLYGFFTREPGVTVAALAGDASGSDSRFVRPQTPPATRDDLHA